MEPLAGETKPGAVGRLQLKVAVTFLLEFIVRTRLPVPEQSPDQLANVEPEAAEAVRVTEAPEL